MVATRVVWAGASWGHVASQPADWLPEDAGLLETVAEGAHVVVVAAADVVAVGASRRT